MCVEYQEKEAGGDDDGGACHVLEIRSHSSELKARVQERVPRGYGKDSFPVAFIGATKETHAPTAAPPPSFLENHEHSVVKKTREVTAHLLSL